MISEEQSRLVKGLLDFCKKEGIEVGNFIEIRMRDCDDVPKYLARMYKAHEETKKSRLRFQGIYNLTVSLN